MKAYLIDPYAETVTEVPYTDIKDIYKLIDADLFDCAHFSNNGDSVFIDDNGLLTMTPETKFFRIEGYPNPLAGKGLVLGCDEQGESISPRTPLADIKVTFLTAMDAYLESTMGDDNHE